MRAWSTRFRRATLLLSVHLLQVFLLAASAVCDLAPQAPSTPNAVAAVAATVDHAHAHHPIDTTRPTPQAPHHESHTTSCPMAMACAATAFVVPVPTVATSEVRIETARIANDADELRSMRLAPEPPPPRG